MPSLKSCFRARGIVAEGCENAPLSGLPVLVVAPPDMASKGSGLVKSVVGVVTASTRPRSVSVRSLRGGSASAIDATRQAAPVKKNGLGVSGSKIA